MMESILKIMNSVFDKFLSASAWSFLSSLRISAESTSDDLTLGVIQVSTKHLNFTGTFPFQNLSSHRLLHHVVQPCTGLRRK